MVATPTITGFRHTLIPDENRYTSMDLSARYEGPPDMPAGYSQALEYIHSFDDPYLAAIRDHGKQTWGLAKIEALLAALGQPQLAYPVIHVAGTKGKGSTSALIARALAESGLKVGLYTSPHLEDWRERIQVNGRLIEKSAVAALADDLRPFAENVPGLSAFEVTTALAFWHFARVHVDAAVIEVGLGGRLDATNVVDPLVSVLTSISLDHTQLLGNTLAEIAGEKAAIIKPGKPAVSAPQPPDAAEVFERRAAETGSRLVVVGRDWQFETLDASLDGSLVRITGPDTSGDYRLGLPGLFQAENAAVAVAALDEARRAGLPVTADGIRAGLAKAKWPGRLEVVGREPLIILDGAHNPYSIGRLADSLAALTPDRPIVYVFGSMADKDVEGMLRHLILTGRRIILTRAMNGRAAAVDELVETARRVIDELTANGWLSDPPSLDQEASVRQAVEAGLASLGGPDDPTLLCITGSLSIVGEARAELAAKRRAHGPPKAIEAS